MEDSSEASPELLAIRLEELLSSSSPGLALPAGGTDGGSFLKDLKKAVVDDNDDVVGDDEEVGEPADSS